MTATLRVSLAFALASTMLTITPSVVAADDPMVQSAGSLPCPNQVPPGQPCYFDRQWNLQAIGIEEAWEQGAFGSEKVRVAILDTGIDYEHPDLAGRVDLKDSISLVSHQQGCRAGEPGTPSVTGPNGEDQLAIAQGRLPFHDYHSHGTAVAGLVASNGHYLAGVTRETTLIAIKVHDRGRRNCLSVYLEGIDEAVKRGADVIHLSFPLEFTKADYPGAVDLINATTERAHRKGAVLVAAAGNAAEALDPDGPQFRFCHAAHVICVSATGPIPTNPDPDRSADYTNFGLSSIDVAGPGGSGTSLGAGMVRAITPVWLHCTRVPGTELRDANGGLILPAGRSCTDGPSADNRLIWTSIGTSFGAAATSGLAALLVSNARWGQPELIENLMEDSAVDVTDVPDSDRDQAGPDQYYGNGRIDVAAALALTP